MSPCSAPGSSPPYGSAGGHGGGARHQRGVQDLEEEHAVPLRPGDDTRARVAQPHRAVAAGRHQVRGRRDETPQHTHTPT